MLFLKLHSDYNAVIIPVIHVSVCIVIAFFTIFFIFIFTASFYLDVPFIDCSLHEKQIKYKNSLQYKKLAM